jgi:uncharacterized protein (DUF2126 family)/transglutaminase-like putative cysteine protease
VNTRVAITHRFEQRFDRPVRLSTHWLRLRPAPETRARVTAYSLQVQTDPSFLNWVRDPFENYLARLDLPEPVTSLCIELEVIAELTPVNPFDFLTEPEATEHPFAYSEQLQKELTPYLARSTPGPRLARWLESIDRVPMATVERLTSVTRQIQAAFAGSASKQGDKAEGLSELFEGDSVAIRADPSWQLAGLLTQSLRHLGIAARCVFGHHVLLAPGRPEHDRVTLHAWTEAYLPGAGWVGLDATTGLFTNETYIPFACTPDLQRVHPIVGYREACEETATESLRVKRLIPHAPAQPYSDTQWADIRALGHHVERDLARQGTAATLGLQLSLVSSTYSGAPEWNGNAVGYSKRVAAEQLLEGLQQRLGLRGVPQLGQGQWFNGEPLPRWRLSYFFRADGQPVWRNPALLDWNWSQPAQLPRSLDSQAFARAVARALGLAIDSVVAAYEDPLYALSRGYGALPPEPTSAELADPQRRKQLAEQLSRPGAGAAGYVLPLAWDHVAQCFRSSAWRFRRSELYLMPGDSPLGYRLPLESLRLDEQSAIESQLERSTFEECAWLPEHRSEATARVHSPDHWDTASNPQPQRTALAVQIRDGRLYVFLPPFSHVEHYIELISAIEAAAEATRSSVVLEGYDPPEDYRLRRFLLEPDAGVLRVSTPETDSFHAHADLIHAVYEEAELLGLRAERTLADGSRAPTGGGASYCLGGTRPIDSPFLRRPEILRTLIAYWQQHPSLSYFFSGRQIGAAGPAPRVDEGRDEATYELSLALDRLGRAQPATLWHSDRVLRHLLTDLAGDTKHAELRVDQLYAPERASLRLGRVFIGSFETAPHPRTAVLQSLLITGLLGRFSRQPESGTLQRWGTALHDRFMLPYILWEDLRSVVNDLQAAGYPFQLEWFESLKALRFPVLGQVPIGTIGLELQRAHEPWPLLAEEMTLDGMTRFIDAANERVQVRLSGLTPSRYVLACNGHYVPLQPTVVHGEFVAGVRYKIANPPATLHPTLPPVSALVFDLIDLWTGRAVGGATYLPPQPQLWGPVGSPLSSVPPTAGDEPAPPRVAPLPYLSLSPLGARGRFLPHGSGLGPMSAPPAYHDPEYPFLLDLTQRT